DRAAQTAAAEVVVYTSVDQPVARPILDEFTRRPGIKVALLTDTEANKYARPVTAPPLDEFPRRTGIKVALLTDTEANKSAGLVARLEAEKSNPKADVWWGNEVFCTINLAAAHVLAP